MYVAARVSLCEKGLLLFDFQILMSVPLVLIIVTLMLSVPTSLVASLVPVIKTTLEMAPAALVSIISYRHLNFEP